MASTGSNPLPLLVIGVLLLRPDCSAVAGCRLRDENGDHREQEVLRSLL